MKIPCKIILQVGRKMESRRSDFRLVPNYFHHKLTLLQRSLVFLGFLSMIVYSNNKIEKVFRLSGALRLQTSIQEGFGGNPEGTQSHTFVRLKKYDKMINNLMLL